jgi:hypothetical protein
MPILFKINIPDFLSIYLDNVTESRLERAVTTFCNVAIKAFSLLNCPKEVVVKKNIIIVAKCFNIITAYILGLSRVR